MTSIKSQHKQSEGGFGGRETRLPVDRAYLRRAMRLALAPTFRNLLHFTSWVVALAVEFTFVYLLRDGGIYEWEVESTRDLQSLPGGEWLFHGSNLLTNTLWPPFLIVLIAVIMVTYLTGRETIAFLLLLTFPLHVLAQFPKALIDRQRPPAGFEGIEGVGGLQSFPSGHAEYVVTFYGFLAYLAVRRYTRGWQRSAIVAGWLALAIATGLGRVATGRHWPLDTLTSYVLGLGLLSGLIWLHTALVAARMKTDSSQEAPECSEAATLEVDA